MPERRSCAGHLDVVQTMSDGWNKAIVMSAATATATWDPYVQVIVHYCTVGHGAPTPGHSWPLRSESRLGAKKNISARRPLLDSCAPSWQLFLAALLLQSADHRPCLRWRHIRAFCACNMRRRVYWAGRMGRRARVTLFLEPGKGRCTEPHDRGFCGILTPRP